MRVDQLEGEILVRLIDPAEQIVAEFDRVIGELGSEQVHWLVPEGAGGTWTLELVSTDAGPVGRYRIEWVARRPPDDLDRRRLEAEARERTARRFRMENRRQEAARQLSEALRIRERAFGVEDREVVPVLLEIAGLLMEGRNGGEAEPVLRRAAGILRKEPVDAVGLGEALNQLALALSMQGKDREAAAVLEEALRRQRGLPERERAVAGMLNNLAITYRRLQDLDEAGRVSREALELRRRLLGPEHRDVAQSYFNLGVLARERGVLVQALTFTGDALRLFRETLGDRHPEVVRGEQHLATLLIESGRLEEAAATLSEALEHAESLYGPLHREVSGILLERSRVLRELGRLGEARADLERARAVQETLLGPDHSSLGEMMREQGIQIMAEGAIGVAEGFFRQSVIILEKSLGAGHPETAHSLLELAACLLRLPNRRSEAASALSLAHHVAAHNPVPWPLQRGIAGLTATLAEGEEAVRDAVRQLRLLELNEPSPDSREQLGHWLHWEKREAEWRARTLELTFRFEGEEAAAAYLAEGARYHRFMELLAAGEERFGGLPEPLAEQFRERSRQLRERSRLLHARSEEIPVPLPPVDDLAPVLELLIEQGNLIREEIEAREALRPQ